MSQSSRGGIGPADAVAIRVDGVADRVFSTQSIGGHAGGVRSVTKGGVGAGTFSAIAKNLRIAAARPQFAIVSGTGRRVPAKSPPTT